MSPTGGNRAGVQELIDSLSDDDRKARIMARLQEAVAAGRISWNGGRLEPIEPAIKHMTGKSLSEIVIEDRGE